MATIEGRVGRLEKICAFIAAPKAYDHAQIVRALDLIEAGETVERAYDLVGPPTDPVEPSKPTIEELIAMSNEDAFPLPPGFAVRLAERGYVRVRSEHGSWRWRPPEHMRILVPAHMR